MEYVENTIVETLDKFADKFIRKYDEIVEFPLYRAEGFRKDYLKEIIADSSGYAGTEIIRRVVGDSKVMEVTSVKDLEERVPMEKNLIEIGIRLIKNRYRIKSGRDIVEMMKQA